MTSETVEPDSQPNLVLGIDTGGTYTDGVLLEYETRRVLAAHKSLTTKRDFSIGIENVIEAIRIEDPSAIRMVSISTTLATNAIAEGKGKRIALLLIGYDPDLISAFQMFIIPWLATTNEAVGVPPRGVYLYMVNIYRQIFRVGRFGYGMAMLWLLIIVIMALTLLVFRTQRYWVYSEVEG